MVISHTRNFIFVHLYKTGGTSVSSALSQYGHSSFSMKARLFSVIGLRPAIYSEDFPKHIPLLDLRQELPGKIFNGYFKFAFVRNSWDWQVSLYHHILKDQSNQHHAIVKSLGGFEEYLVWRTQSRNVRLQQAYVCDSNGNLLTNFLGNYSKLHEDLQKVTHQMGLGDLILPHLNAGDRNSYQDYYSPKGKDLIYQAYKPDIKTFGFEF